MLSLGKLKTLLPAIIAQQCRTKSSIASNKQSRILNKLIGGKRPTANNKWFENATVLPSAASLSKEHRQSKHITRRINVLNKLFMVHISDMLANGEWSQQIAGHGLEITHVRITSDFHLVNVYWMTKRMDSTATLKQMLEPIARRIRHELSQLRLMGEVPNIIFVHDRSMAKLAEVDHLLAKADFGDDYEPLTPAAHRAAMMRNDFSPSSANSADAVGFRLPPMRQDIFGLDRGEIMNKIVARMTKNRQAWEKYELQMTSLNQMPVDVAANTFADSKDVLARFLIKKQYHRGKIQRQRRIVGDDASATLQLGGYQSDEDLDCPDDFVEDFEDDDWQLK